MRLVAMCHIRVSLIRMVIAVWCGIAVLINVIIDVRYIAMCCV